mgnify:CR=1 FL=1
MQCTFFEPAQPRLLGLGAGGEMAHGSSGGTQHARDVTAIAPAPADLRAERLGRNRTPDRDRGRMHQLIADQFDIAGSLVEFGRDAIEIGQWFPLFVGSRGDTDERRPAQASVLPGNRRR